MILNSGTNQQIFRSQLISSGHFNELSIVISKAVHLLIKPRLGVVFFWFPYLPYALTSTSVRPTAGTVILVATLGTVLCGLELVQFAL